ncbi:MAG: LuxR C-terminal-related transcriptional regulator, partial [Butyrivibrio sp.]|nr:LuxR C-terminal-related transcriptional regulator [Butyrivibrio sp.]
EKDIEQYCNNLGFKFDEKEIDKLYKWSMGNPKSLQLIARLAEENDTMFEVTEELLDKAREIFREYIMLNITDSWSSELLEFLMQISVVDSFNIEMAEMVTGNGHARGIISSAENIGSFLDNENFVYTIKRPLLLALPHRGSKDLIQIMKNIPKLIFDNGMRLPEFSVTSNLPSVMNGGKDFCEWSLRDDELAASIGKLVEMCLGAYGKGIVNQALGESYYEKGRDAYDVISHLSKAQMKAQVGGKKEMEFAALGILVRLGLFHGKEEDALEQLNSFELSLPEDSPKLLKQNIEALRTRIALYDGNMEKVQIWLLEQSPDETKEFFILERYRYLTKVRCYMALGEDLMALALLEKLYYYAESFDRPYVKIETSLLKAIVNKRLAHPYMDCLEEAIEGAKHYSFTRVISEEGTAVTGLLNEYRKYDERKVDINDGWFDAVVKEAGTMENLYPSYLRGNIVSKSDFSEQALSVLYYLAKGYSIPQVGKEMNMKPETVKYHTKQIYKKLGVSGKSDAILTARNLGIL